MRRFHHLALAVTVIAAGTATSAHADIITALSGAPAATGDGYFAYTYNVQLSGGQLDATNGSATSPSPLQFGTVYDFGPLETSSSGVVNIATTGLLATAFAFSFNGTDSPAAYATAPADSAALANVRFTYTGTDNLVVAGDTTTQTSYTALAPSQSNLGTFTVYSPFAAYASGNNYDGQTYKGTNDTVQGNIGLLATPVVDTPEPASLALLGAGLLGLGMLRRRRA